MLWQHGKQKPPSRWFWTNRLIKKWMRQRTELLVLYNQLIIALKGDDLENKKEALKAFCEILIDYTSMGHFKVFEKLSEAYQICQPENPSLDEATYRKILKTTEVIVGFNDKYAPLFAPVV